MNSIRHDYVKECERSLMEKWIWVGQVGHSDKDRKCRANRFISLASCGFPLGEDAVQCLAGSIDHREFIEQHLKGM
jgi:hypothetical protein